MRQNYSDTISFGGKFENEDHLSDAGWESAIHLPPNVGNVVFYVIRTMLHVFQMKGLFGGQSNEYANNHHKNFINISIFPI